jgi:hypothetical protein
MISNFSELHVTERTQVAARTVSKSASGGRRPGPTLTVTVDRDRAGQPPGPTAALQPWLPGAGTGRRNPDSHGQTPWSLQA